MFIYSLPLIFTYTNLGTPFELLVIVLLLWVVLYLSAPVVNEELPDRPFNYSLYFYLLYGLNGQLRLSQVFWPFFLLLNLGIYAADYAVKMGEISVSSWDDVYIMFFFVSLVWVVAIWRSSANTTKKSWAAYARLMTLAVFFEYGLKIFIRNEYAAIFFNCQDRMLDYITCF